MKLVELGLNRENQQTCTKKYSWIKKKARIGPRKIHLIQRRPPLPVPAVDPRFAIIVVMCVIV
jgi:hypothetical protein